MNQFSVDSRSIHNTIHQHIIKCCIFFRSDYIMNRVDPSLHKYIVVSKSILAEAIEHALDDVERMRVWHMPDAQPDRHKWAGFVAKWIAKMRPIQCSFNTSCVLPETGAFLNAKLSVYIFQSFLNTPIPEVFY